MNKISLILILLCGCITTSEKRSSQSVQSAEAIATESERTTRRTFEMVPHMAAVASTNSGVPVSVSETLETTTRTSTGAGSEDRSKGSSASTFPLFVKLIGSAIGLGLLWLVIWLWRRSSVAVNTLYKSADRLIAEKIGAVEARARESTNPEELNRLNAELVTLEKQRGKLASEKSR